MSITTDRPRTPARRVHEPSSTRYSDTRARVSTPVRDLLLQEPEATQPTQAQPSVVKIFAGVVATAAILLGLVSIANARAIEPIAPSTATTSGISYDVGVASAPLEPTR